MIDIVYTVVQERQARVYMLFGKVLLVLDQPGFHLLWLKLGWKAPLANWIGRCHVLDLLERTNIVFVTNATSGDVLGYATREPMSTNLVTAVVTNVVPVFMTNLVQVPVTNLVERPEVAAGISAAGSILNTFLPGVGSIVALALGGLYHGYRQVRNKKVNEALIQGVETAREVLATTPQGQAADAQFVRWLMQNQKQAGVFTTVASLVEQLSDNPAAKLTAQEILDRLRLAEQGRVGQPGASAVGCTGGSCVVPASIGPGVSCPSGQCTVPLS